VAKKRKDITGIDELLGGKPGASGTTPAASAKTSRPAAPAPTRKRGQASKPAAGKSAPLVTAGAQQKKDGSSKPMATRVAMSIALDMEAISVREGVPVADLLRFAIGRFVTDYQAGHVELPKEKRITYRLKM